MAHKSGSNSSRARLQGFFGSRRASSPATSHSAPSGPTPVAARSFSGRWLVTLFVLALVAVSVYGTVSRYFNQSAEINQVKANIASLEAENRELSVQQSWWGDENYVKQQAKSRLFYVNPGEVPYLVVGTDYTTELTDETSADALTAPEDSWTTKLWDSFQLSAVNGDPVGYAQQNTKTASETPSPSSNSTDSSASTEPPVPAESVSSTPPAP